MLHEKQECENSDREREREGERKKGSQTNAAGQNKYCRNIYTSSIGRFPSLQ